MIFLRSVVVYISTLFWSLLFWAAALPAALFSIFLSRRARSALFRTLLGWFGLLTVRVAWGPFFKVCYEPLADGENEQTPCVYILNHRSAIDAFLVALLRSRCVQTVNGWPLRVPVLGSVAKLAGYLDITHWGYEELLKNAAEAVAGGDSIVAFPEGTRSESRNMNVFHSGVFRLAMDLKLPVNIMCIAGNEFMPDRQFRFRMFGKVLVRRIPGISADEVSQCSSAFVLKKMVFNKMKEELVRMDGQLDDEKTL